jgi:vWA-MoxR associated protein C-terminal domain/Effector-associated domain 1
VRFDAWLQKGLLEAFPDIDRLRGVVQQALGVPLQNITMAGDMPTVVLNLTVRLRAENRLRMFLQGAREANPANQAIRNAVCLYDLLPLLEGGDAWRTVAHDIYLHLPRPGLGGTRLEDELQLEAMALALGGDADWKDDTIPHVPLLDFIQLLTERIEAEAQAKARLLRIWLDLAVADLGWDFDDVERMRFGWRRLARRPGQGYFARLLMRVNPEPPPGDKDANGQDIYAVKAWLVDTADARPLLGEAGRRGVKCDLRKLMDECRVGLGRVGLRPDEVRLELTLPRALLVEAIDQWEDPEDDTPLGSLHSLVLRCWERLKKDEWSAALGRHLKTFRSARTPLIPVWDLDAPAGDEPEAVWIGAARSGGARLRISLQKRAGCCVCVLERAPTPAVGEPKTDVLNTLLRAGIPAVLWVRQPPDPEATLRDAFKALFEPGVYLEHLPDTVYKLRLNAVGCETWHLGKHIALIWDDPRFPPSPEDDYTFRLRSPAQ